MVIKILTFLAISAVIYLTIALVLILTNRPVAKVPSVGGLDFTNQLTQVTKPLPLEPVSMRDGYALMTRHLPGPGEDAPLLVLVHGSGWHGAQFDGLAARLKDVAEVLAPDLRGHGTAPGRRGDIDYIGQFEDDLADLITAKRKPGQKVILAGHSSGGGLVVRFAGGAHGDMIDGAVLMAPYLKYNAPTTRTNSGGWAYTLGRRIVGLAMLNNIRIHLLDRLVMIQFNMPQAVLDGPLGDTAATAYSWRLNVSYSPRNDYLKDVAALPLFLLVGGQADESFVAEAYQPLMQGVTEKGRYLVLDGVSHLDVVNDVATGQAIREFIDVIR